MPVRTSVNSPLVGGHYVTDHVHKTAIIGWKLCWDTLETLAAVLNPIIMPYDRQISEAQCEDVFSITSHVYPGHQSINKMRRL